MAKPPKFAPSRKLDIGFGKAKPKTKAAAPKKAKGSKGGGGS